MGTWILMFISCLLTPAIVMAFGNVLKSSAPGQINALFGYRTTMSMKNKDTWEFANTLWGKLACKWGLWLLICSAVVMVAVIFACENVVTIVGIVLLFLQIVIILGTIPVVERALKKEFDKDGNRRNTDKKGTA